MQIVSYFKKLDESEYDHSFKITSIAFLTLVCNAIMTIISTFIYKDRDFGKYFQLQYPLFQCGFAILVLPSIVIARNSNLNDWVWKKMGLILPKFAIKIYPLNDDSVC